ncbi:hypothetical protein SLE2022_288730 [Rubroshorea leprosula]
MMSNVNVSSPQKDMQISKNCGGGRGNGSHVSGSAAQLSPTGPTSPSMEENYRQYKRTVVRYKDCMKNHAAAIGGNAIDGCGEFMPSGEEGTIEALKCSACGCHRNFHRKEIECDCPFECYHSPVLNNGGRKLILGPHNYISAGNLIASRVDPPHQVIVSYKGGSDVPSESDEKDDGGGGVVAARPVEKVRKRFRTKFTQEQKEKMLDFAERAGWRIQKLEDSVVQQFCQELGIKRRVLKVWMHNNKHSLAKKIEPTT